MARRKRDGTLEFRLGARPIPVEGVLHPCERGVCLAQRFIDLQSPLGCCLRLWISLLGSKDVIARQHAVTISHSGVR
jgi:hypothetical protein